MIWYFRRPEKKVRCIGCSRLIGKGSKVELGFHPKWGVPLEVANLLFKLMVLKDNAKFIKQNEKTKEYYILAPDPRDNIIFCWNCLGEFCKEYLGRLESKIEITELH